MGVVSILFGTWRSTELICYITVIDLPISPTYCCYTTLENFTVIVVLGQHTMHIRRLSFFSVKFLNSFLRNSGLQIIPMLALLTVKYRTLCRTVSIRRQFETWTIWDSAWLIHGITCRRALWTMLVMNDGREFRFVWMKNEYIWTLAIVIPLELRLVVQINKMLFLTV